MAQWVSVATCSCNSNAVRQRQEDCWHLLATRLAQSSARDSNLKGIGGEWGGGQDT